jgi:hypothetical protein
MPRSTGFSLMPEVELFLLFVRPFNQAGIRYIIGGSVAAIFYGEPRLTNDVDFVAFPNEADIRRLPEIFHRPIFTCLRLKPSLPKWRVNREAISTSSINVPVSKRMFIPQEEMS